MRIKRRYVLWVTLLTIILCCFFVIMAIAGKIKAAEIPSKQTITCTVDGVERSMIWAEDNSIYFTIGESEPICISSSDSSLLDLMFDKYGSCWLYNYDGYNDEFGYDEYVLRWWNYDLLPNMPISNVIPKLTSENENVPVNNIESIISDDSGFIIGYRTFSGEEYAIPTVEDMKFILSTDDYLLYPQPRPLDGPTVAPSVTPTSSPLVTPSPVPTASPIPTSVPTVTPTVSPTATPTLVPTLITTATPTLVPTLITTATPTLVPTLIPTAEPTPAPTTAPPVSKLIKKGAYTCLTVSDKVVSKYKLQKSTLTWTAASKKIKVKKVKKVGYTTDGKCVYLTKKGQVGIISTNGKKRIFLKKGAKKLLFKKNFIVGIQTNKKKIKL